MADIISIGTQRAVDQVAHQNDIVKDLRSFADAIESGERSVSSGMPAMLCVYMNGDGKAAWFRAGPSVAAYQLVGLMEYVKVCMVDDV